MCPRFRQPGDKPRAKPPVHLHDRHACSHSALSSSPGADAGASYPRQAPLRPEIRHQGCVAGEEALGETRAVDWGVCSSEGGGFHLTAVILGRGLWTAGAKGLVRSAAQISTLRHGAKRQKIRQARGRNDVDDDGLSWQATICFCFCLLSSFPVNSVCSHPSFP